MSAKRMEAGRDLDLKVAKILGVYPYEAASGGYARYDYAPYSSDIDGWSILKDTLNWLDANKYRVEISNTPQGWFVGLRKNTVTSAIEKSLPHAVCLALLEAVGKEK